MQISQLPETAPNFCHSVPLSHMPTVSPTLLCQRMSECPLPLKSPTPATCQESGDTAPNACQSVPLSHMPIVPLPLHSQRISEVPLSLKSPTPTTSHDSHEAAPRPSQALLFPRQGHRPACFFRDDPDRLLVSPGIIDLAGVLVTPRPRDFQSISTTAIQRIFTEVCQPAETISAALKYRH